jgi:hypothetical protein
MTSATPSSGGRDIPAARQPQPTDTPPGKTPGTDMQAEDTGTPDSGNADSDDSGAAATRAMKQTSKTAAESGNGR